MNLSAKNTLVARAEAAAWITQLHGPQRSAEMEEGCRKWLSERAENAREFEGLTEVWDLVAGGAPARGVPRLERWEHTAEARELKALRERGQRRLPPIAGLWTAAALVLLACGALTHRFWAGTSYATAVGEQRIVQLEDGSVVSLNSNSRLKVDYESNSRRIQLEQGEALFQVAKAPDRPFIVTAGDNRVTAVGTSFLIRFDDQRTAITLVEGRIAVHSSTRFAVPLKNQGSSSRVPSMEEFILSPGQRLTLTAKIAPQLDMPQLESVTAWRRGEVVLDDTSLADAVAEMNRYDQTQIVIAHPDIETLSVSGLYHTGDSEGFARSVVQMYGLTLIAREGQIRLER